MDISIAEKILIENEHLYNALDRIADVVEAIENIEERKKFRRAISIVMGDARHLLNKPIVKQFPDLDKE